MSDEGAGRPKVKTRIIKTRNKLKAKVTASQQPVAPGEQSSFAKGALERAEAEMADAAARYVVWVQDTVRDLAGHFRRATEAPPSSAERAEALKSIGHIAHELRGQGGTFGFPLITAFAGSLFKFTQGDGSDTPERMSVVKAHVDAIRVVFAQEIRGDGGQIGQALVQALQQAIKKFNAN
jgi:chemotaxis protein histidine kinase CheA